MISHVKYLDIKNPSRCFSLFILFFAFFSFFANVQNSNATESTKMSQNSQELEIVSLQITYSNGSIAPNYRTTTTWYLSNKSEEFKKIAADVIANSKVNGSLPIPEFLENPDKAPPKQERPSDEIGSGAGQYDVVMTFNNGKTIDVGDYAPYGLSTPYNDLFNVTKEKGTAVTTDGGPESVPQLDPKPMPPTMSE